ncbi:cellulose biosynthesis protein BcsR [Proteus terrae]
MCFYVIEIMYFKAYSKIESLNKYNTPLINHYFIEILILIEIYFFYPEVIKMKNESFINSNMKIEKNNLNKDIDKLKKLFSLNNYHYQDINKEEQNSVLIYRWPLLNAFHYMTK